MKIKRDERITGYDDSYPSDVKRFYIPGYLISSECPKCGMESTYDMMNVYLDYPEIGAPVDVEFGCIRGYTDATKGQPECNASWIDQVVVKVTLDAVMDQPGHDGIETSPPPASRILEIIRQAAATPHTRAVIDLDDGTSRPGKIIELDGDWVMIGGPGAITFTCVRYIMSVTIRSEEAE